MAGKMAFPPDAGKDTRFKPGWAGGPGRAKGSLRRDEVEAVMGRLSRMTREELEAIVRNPKSTMLEIMSASVIVKAAKEGDSARFSFLLDRTIGRVKEQIEVSAVPYIIERRDGSTIEMGVKKPSELDPATEADVETDDDK